MATHLPPLKHRLPHRGLLPEGRHAALTWALPDELGTLTSQTIARCNAFATRDNRRVELFTLTPDQDIPARARQLRAAGLLHRKVQVRNLWSDLLAWPDKRLVGLEGTVATADTHSPSLLTRAGSDWTMVRADAAGKTLQVDRYRADGTVLVSDVRDTKQRGKPGGRCITLFDRAGTPLAEWHSAREFYWAWIDSILTDKRCFLLVDSPFVAGFMHDYRRENVATAVVLHDDHVAVDDGTPLDPSSNPLPNPPIVSAMLQAVSHLDAFDAAVGNDARRVDQLRNSGIVDERLTVLPYPELEATHDAQTVAAWGAALAAARFDRLRPWERPRAKLVSAATGDDSIDIVVHVGYVSGRIPARAYLTWKSIDRRFFGRVEGTWGICSISATIPLETFAGVPDGTLELLVDLVQPRDFARMKVTAANGTYDNRSPRVSVGADDAGKVVLTLARGDTQNAAQNRTAGP